MFWANGCAASIRFDWGLNVWATGLSVCFYPPQWGPSLADIQAPTQWAWRLQECAAALVRAHEPMWRYTSTCMHAWRRRAGKKCLLCLYTCKTLTATLLCVSEEGPWHDMEQQLWHIMDFSRGNCPAQPLASLSAAWHTPGQADTSRMLHTPPKSSKRTRKKRLSFSGKSFKTSESLPKKQHS